MSLNNKHAIVTGGANGIGRCIAEAFLREGALVTIIDIDKSAGELLQSNNEKLKFYYGNIAEKTTLDAFVDTIDKQVNFFVSNACFSKNGLLSSCSYEDFEYVQRVGVTAPYYLTNLFWHKGKFASNAAVVNIASTRAFQSQSDTESYSAAKGAILSLTHAMAVSLAGNVRVNCISPGWIETADYHSGMVKPNHSKQDNSQHSAGRVGIPEDIANMVLYLCSDKAGFITGQNFIVDGGMSKLMIYHGDNGWQLN